MIRHSLPLAAGVAAALTTAAALAQDDEVFDRTPQRCVIVANIDQTEAVDDQTLIFRMRGRAVYRNQLPRACPGLERENRIMYETRSSRLCSNDTVTVLEDLGIGLRPGFTCRLGEFLPMSPADVEELEQLEEGRSGRSAIETRPIELPDEDGEPAEPIETDEAEADDAED